MHLPLSRFSFCSLAISVLMFQMSRAPESGFIHCWLYTVCIVHLCTTCIMYSVSSIHTCVTILHFWPKKLQYEAILFKLKNCQIYVFSASIFEVNHGLMLFCYVFCMVAQDARSISLVPIIESPYKSF